MKTAFQMEGILRKYATYHATLCEVVFHLVEARLTKAFTDNNI